MHYSFSIMPVNTNVRLVTAVRSNRYYSVYKCNPVTMSLCTACNIYRVNQPVFTESAALSLPFL